MIAFGGNIRPFQVSPALAGRQALAIDESQTAATNDPSASTTSNNTDQRVTPVQESEEGNTTNNQQPQQNVLSPLTQQTPSSSLLDNPNELTEEEQAIVRDLQQRDREVRAHEQAHATVGGPYAGSPTYTFQRGPDGRQYAIGGEVQIDSSPEQDPEATIRKLEIVIRAALAPAEPSAQDRQVAQQAAQGIIQARSELRQEQAREQREETNSNLFSNEQSQSAFENLQALIEQTQSTTTDNDDQRQSSSFIFDQPDTSVIFSTTSITV